MVKVGTKRNKRKVCKKHVNFTKAGGKFAKIGVGENKISRSRWNELKHGNKGKLKFEMCGDENLNFFGKR